MSIRSDGPSRQHHENDAFGRSLVGHPVSPVELGEVPVVVFDGADSVVVEAVFFDTPGCLLAYLVLPDEHATDEPVETIWFTDFETRDLFEADDGYLVEETDMGRHSFPMGGSPIPFEASDDAEAYVEEHDLHDDAVRTIDDVDREFAEFYRGNRMPDE